VNYPPIKSGIRYEIWRWREDVAKWALVSQRPTLAEAQERCEKEIATWSELPVLRITETTITRQEVDAR
jgi:hypothetical protein